MSVGLDAAAGIAGIISLSVTAFQGCVKGLQLIAAARVMKEDQERIRSIIEWEQYRLIEWGHRVGIDTRADRDSSFNWPIAANILKQLERLLTDTEVLRTQYGLTSDEQSKAGVVGTFEGSPAVQKTGLAKLWNHARPELQAVRARMIQETGTTFKKLKWITFDCDKLSELLRQIGMRNFFAVSRA